MNSTITAIPTLSDELALDRDDKMVQRIIAYLMSLPVGISVTEPQIEEQVEGRTAIQREALRSLVEQKLIRRTGDGVRNDPYKYSFPRSDEHSYRIVEWQPKSVSIRLSQCSRSTPVDIFAQAALNALEAELRPLKCWGHGAWGLDGLLTLLAARGVFLVILDQKQAHK
jgi:hypothetical protein